LSIKKSLDKRYSYPSILWSYFYPKGK